MCGLVAALRTDGGPLERRMVERMAEVIRHRGPDDQGAYFSGNVGLGFRRLSILDTSPLGHQPMSAEDGRASIVFNGEIYNYVELRRELEGFGHRFTSSGDTEVLLKAYLQWGTDCLPRLNGMWAFVIHDKRTHRLFASRDRFGIKPLYLWRGQGHVLLASEIKAIRASGLYADSTNMKVAAAYLLEDRLDEGTETFYTGIDAVAPATAVELDLDGTLRQWRYWSIPEAPQQTADDPAKAFAELFEDAVRLHMRSDVPVGVNLSGGLDSTSIICASARVREAQRAQGPLMAFCYQAPQFDESAYIDATVKRTGATLVNLDTSPESLWRDLSRMLWYQDEPVHSMTAVIGYQLMRLARQHGVKVILNGQGADETIGGYGNYFRDYWHTLLTQGRMAKTWQEIRAHAAVHGGQPLALLLTQLRHLAQSALHAIPAYRAKAAAAARKRLCDSARWFDAGLVNQIQTIVARQRFDLESVLRRSVEISPLPIYLRVEDRNSMAHSVEARLPFLDYRLVELVFSLSADWHLRGPLNKFVLREAMQGRIPESVRRRPDKMGFPFPAQQWFSGVLREPLLDVLNGRAARERGIYESVALLRDVEHGSRTSNYSSLFRIAQFELWNATEAAGSRAASQPMSMVM